MGRVMIMHSRNIFRDNAAKYAELGWAIFPLTAGDKVPMRGTNGLHNASNDRAQIEAWSLRHPDANIAIRCGKASNVVVIDCDPRNGSDETVAKLARVGKTFPDTCPEASTPRAGRHLYCAYDERVQASKVHALGPGVDLKTDGGYIVLPPSWWAKQDAGYRWIVPPRGNCLPPLPRWVIQALQPKPAPKRAPSTPIDTSNLSGYRRQAVADLQDLAQQMATLGDGRHTAPFSMACRIGKYRAHGLLTDAEIESAFLDASTSNEALSKYTEKDLITQIRNGIRRATSDQLPPLARRYRLYR
jgi:hypothetical protein